MDDTYINEKIKQDLPLRTAEESILQATRSSTWEKKTLHGGSGEILSTWAPTVPTRTPCGRNVETERRVDDHVTPYESPRDASQIILCA